MLKIYILTEKMLSDLRQGSSAFNARPTVPMNGSLARQNKSPLGSQAVKSSPLKTSPRLIDKLSDFPPALEDPAVFGQRCYQLQGSAGLGAKWFDAGVHGVDRMEQERSDSTSTKSYRQFGQQANGWSLSGRTGPFPLLSKHTHFLNVLIFCGLDLDNCCHRRRAPNSQNQRPEWWISTYVAIFW